MAQKHKPKCLGEDSILVKVNCTYCEKQLSSQDARRVHEKKKHGIQNNAGFLVVNTEASTTQSELEIKENVCNVHTNSAHRKY